MTSNWSCDQRVTWLYGWVSLPVSLHLPKFGVYQYFASEDIMYLNYHVTSQDHLIGGGHVSLWMCAPYGISVPWWICCSYALGKYRCNIFNNFSRELTWGHKVCVNLWVNFPHGKLGPYHDWWPLVYCQWRYKIFILSYDLTK